MLFNSMWIVLLQRNNNPVTHSVVFSINLFSNSNKDQEGIKLILK